MDIPPRYKWDIMWGGEDNGTYYTKKYFYKQLNWFSHHNDRYTVVATMNLELKAIIQVYLNNNVNSKKYLLQPCNNHQHCCFYIGYNHQKILDKAVAKCKMIGIFRLKGISSVEYFNVQ